MSNAMEGVKSSAVGHVRIYADAVMERLGELEKLSTGLHELGLHGIANRIDEEYGYIKDAAQSLVSFANMLPAEHKKSPNGKSEALELLLWAYDNLSAEYPESDPFGGEDSESTDWCHECNSPTWEHKPGCEWLSWKLRTGALLEKETSK